MYQTPTGIHDILPEEWPYRRHVLAMAERLAGLYGFERIDTPILEVTQVFERGAGEGAAVMLDKEMYTFADKGGDSLTLAAGVHGWHRARLFAARHAGVRPQPVKLYTLGPIFRQERPQAGRYRQHTQWNVEVIGEVDLAADFEVMSIAWSLFSEWASRGWPSNSTPSAAPARPAGRAIWAAY